MANQIEWAFQRFAWLGLRCFVFGRLGFGIAIILKGKSGMRANRKLYIVKQLYKGCAR